MGDRDQLLMSIANAMAIDDCVFLSFKKQNGGLTQNLQGGGYFRKIFGQGGIPKIPPPLTLYYTMRVNYAFDVKAE